MPLSNGLYRLAVLTPQGDDQHGVCVLTDGKLRGGDSTLAYVGQYKQKGDEISIALAISAHRKVPGIVSALGHDNLIVEMEGTADEGIAILAGSSQQAPWVKFSARLTMIADRTNLWYDARP